MATETLDLESLWNYDEPAESAVRFEQALETVTDPDLAAEIRTQIARTFSLRREFEAAHRELDSLDESLDKRSPRVRIRYLLERGRTLNSSKKPAEARVLFIGAYDLAVEAKEEYLGADAAHMIAIASDGDDAIDWNQRTIDMAQRSGDPKAKKWIASATNNLGWSYHALGRHEEALEQFERAVELRDGGPKPNLIIARWCVARTLRSLGRFSEALTKQLDLAVQIKEAGQKDGFVNEEIGECLLALGREEEAIPHLARAYEVLSEDPWFVANEPERLNRLQEYASRQVAG